MTAPRPGATDPLTQALMTERYSPAGWWANRAGLPAASVPQPDRDDELTTARRRRELIEAVQEYDAANRRKTR